MKSIVLEQPGTLTLIEKEIPTIQTGEALIKIERIGVCGTDIHAFHGRQPFFSYPRILGHELSGEIVEMKGEAGDFVVGEKVTIIPYLECGKCVACRRGKTNCCTDLQVLGVHTDGGMQKYISVPISHLIKINQLTHEQAATIECLSIGAHAVRRAEIKKDEWVLVIGMGPIGLSVMQFAKNAGAKVIVMDMSEERLEFAEKWASPEYTVNAQNDPLEKIKEMTNGEFPTVVFDATGNPNSMNNAYQFVAHSGRIVFVGLFQGDLQFPDPEFHKRELTILSSRNATKEDFDTVIKAIEEGNVDISAFVTEKVAFDSLPEKFETMFKPGNSNIKVLVEL